MKVYISCHLSAPAEDLAVALRAAGHEVVSVWHAGGSPRPDPGDAAAWAAAAARNMAAVSRAEVLVVVAGPDRYPGGKFVEAGYALASGVGVFTLGGVENGMLWHPAVRHARDAADLLGVLAEVYPS